MMRKRLCCPKARAGLSLGLRLHAECHRHLSPRREPLHGEPRTARSLGTPPRSAEQTTCCSQAVLQLDAGGIHNHVNSATQVEVLYAAFHQVEELGILRDSSKSESCIWDLSHDGREGLDRPVLSLPGENTPTERTVFWTKRSSKLRGSALRTIP